MPSAEPLLRLARWPNVLLSAAGVVAGGWWAARDVGAPRLWIASLAAASLTVFANADNDLQDVEVDRIAHPERPLPSGTVVPRVARRVAALTAAGGVALSATVSLLLAGAAAAFLALAAWYNRSLKRHGLAGNALVATLASLPFAWGAVAVGSPLAVAPLLGVAIPLHLARELAKDLDDVPGDAGQRRTLPIVAGPVAARATAVAATALAFVLCTPVVLGRPLLAVALLPAAALAIAAAARLVAGAPGSPLLYKSSMVLATAGLLAAGTP